MQLINVYFAWEVVLEREKACEDAQHARKRLDVLQSTAVNLTDVDFTAIKLFMKLVNANAEIWFPLLENMTQSYSMYICLQRYLTFDFEVNGK